jgi:hypothetical protein
MKLFRDIAAFLAALGLAFAPALAIAQPVTPPQVVSITTGDLIQDIPNGVVYPTNYYASVLQLRSFVLGQNSTHLSAPTLTTSTSICGGSAATVSGTDTSGQITQGSTASTSCVVTFAKAFTTAPECFVSINNVADTALKCSTSTTALTITQTSASSNVTNYLVIGLPGG